jgi:Tfp pilus assembly protein FimV
VTTIAMSNMTERRGTSRRSLSTAERLALIALAGVLVVCALASRAGTPGADNTTSLRVVAGDTLWAIAEQNRVAGLSTAQTADLIAQLNGLKTSTLTPGRVLEIPASEADATHLAAR